MRHGEDDGADDGAAIVEFTLVAVLLTALFLALLQFGLALYVRNTLTAAVAEGARVAANADRGLVDGEQATRTLIRTALADSFADDVTSGVETVNGIDTVYVEVRAQLPLVGFLGPARSLTVRGHALDEESLQ